jgi:hypothetical protein
VTRPNFELLWSLARFLGAMLLTVVVYFAGGKLSPLTLSLAMLSSFGLGLCTKTRLEQFIVHKLDEMQKDLDKTL